MPEFATAAFAFEVRGVISLIIGYGGALLSLIACIHCAVQKPDVFSAVGTLSKGTWLGILVISLVLALLFGGRVMMFALVAIAAALVYLLDVRTGIKDIGGSAY
jgi:multisubunit Na+/H+ antiporter MnhG subunit